MHVQSQSRPAPLEAFPIILPWIIFFVVTTGTILYLAREDQPKILNTRIDLIPKEIHYQVIFRSL